MKTLTMIVPAVAVLVTASPARADVARDTLDLNVTFVGDREVLMRDAHKEMHWPEPAVIARQKPNFSYTVLPKRIDVQPTWERKKRSDLK